MIWTLPESPLLATAWAAPMTDGSLAAKMPLRSGWAVRMFSVTASAWLESLLLDWVVTSWIPGCFWRPCLKPLTRWSLVIEPGWNSIIATLPWSWSAWAIRSAAFTADAWLSVA